MRVTGVINGRLSCCKKGLQACVGENAVLKVLLLSRGLVWVRAFAGTRQVAKWHKPFLAPLSPNRLPKPKPSSIYLTKFWCRMASSSYMMATWLDITP